MPSSPTLHGSLAERARAGHSPTIAIPSRPRPSADKGIKPPSHAPPDESDELPSNPSDIDVFDLQPLAALRILTETVERLIRHQLAAEAAAVELPTPPRSLGTTPQGGPDGLERKSSPKSGEASPEGPASPGAHHHEDIPRSHKTPIGSPETHAIVAGESGGTRSGSPPGLDISDSKVPPPPPSERAQAEAAAAAAAAQERRLQRRMLARKFYSRAVPPIPLRDYLRRLHTYCPMSTAVYLTTAIYIERLSEGRWPRRKRGKRRRPGDIFDDEDEDDLLGGTGDLLSPVISNESGRDSGCFSSSSSTSVSDAEEDDSEDEEDGDNPILAVNQRTAHRLLLGALRVATKSLEDLSYSHTRFAKVGGISDGELTRLEVSFLFLVRFKLIVGPRSMAASARRLHAQSLADPGE